MEVTETMCCGIKEFYGMNEEGHFDVEGIVEHVLEECMYRDSGTFECGACLFTAAYDVPGGQLFGLAIGEA